jgi:hypothetical protein
LPDYARDRLRHALAVVDPEGSALVVGIVELDEVALQVLQTDVVIRAD